jgi:enterochelin esterase-like enzyme
MRKTFLLLLGAAICGSAAEKVPLSKLIEMAGHKANPPEFKEALLTSVKDGDIKKGLACVGEGPDFLWAVESKSKPTLFVDDEARPGMKQITGSDIWIEIGKLTTGRSHAFHYVIEGKPFGGRFDVPAYGPDSYPKPGVPQGKISEKFVHTSKLYDGMRSDYWIYVPAEYDPNVPAALMVWHDGQGLVDRNGQSRLQDAIDNLTYEKKIPVAIYVFVSPGDYTMTPESPTYNFVAKFSKDSGRTLKDATRSTCYDTVTDRYARLLHDELLPEVEAKYNIRKDGYSHAVVGNSSGGISAFNIAWWHPEWFSRVVTRIGTFTSIQWQPGTLDGGNVFPFAVRKQPKRNIRVWLQDGSEDLENEHGSWPLQNIQMANSLKLREYDFHLSFGNNNHTGASGGAETPEELAWIWRDYDPSKVEQIYQMDPAEKDKPYFRVKIANR